jgi:hypothetical protein
VFSITASGLLEPPQGRVELIALQLRSSTFTPQWLHRRRARLRGTPEPVHVHPSVRGVTATIDHKPLNGRAHTAIARSRQLKSRVEQLAAREGRVELIERQVAPLDDPEPKGDPDGPAPRWTITAAFDLDEGLGPAQRVLDLKAPFRPKPADIRPYPPVSEERVR